MQMRIPKFPHLFHFGPNMHMALPPPGAPLPPAPVAFWLAIPTHAPGPFIFGKYTSAHVSSEGMWNTLFGHDWGPPGAHVCLMPPTHTPTPSSVLVMLGAGHKFWLPSYSVKEPASGGALAAVSGTATSAVAVCLPCGFIVIQDCMDRNGLGFVAPVGINFALPTTHWVGFGWLDFFAGLAAMTMDCIGAILLSKLSNTRYFFSKYSDLTKAFIGLGLGIFGNVLGGLMSRWNAPPWMQVVVGVLLIGVDAHSGVKLDHTGPVGAGIAGGGLADLIGGQGASGDARGEHDPFFDTPTTAPAPAPAPQAAPPPAPAPDAPPAGSGSTSTSTAPPAGDQSVDPSGGVCTDPSAIP